MSDGNRTRRYRHRDDDDDSFAATFARRRLAIGLTQKELADEMHLSVRTLQHWERGSRVPRMWALIDATFREIEAKYNP